ncbi:MAG: putative endopeptidase precursor [Marmoricola sp.]|nr:putative endopeptidase precursor [Marmoricola sp.]
MSAGHNHPFARTTAGLAVTLTLGGLSIVSVSPASAAPDTTSIGAAKSRAASLSHQADVARGRHRAVEKSLSQARKRLKGIDTSINRGKRVVTRLQAEIASMAVDGYQSAGGTSDPTTPPALKTPGSTTLLTGVTAVSEDTGGRTERIAATTESISALATREAGVTVQVTRLAAREATLQRRVASASAGASAAQARVNTLEQRAAAAARAAAAKKADEARQKAVAANGPAVAYALAQVGKAYVWGAAGPSAFDCSGLTMAAWSQAGVSLPHSAAAQYSTGRHISESELAPGDLVFYYSGISHVGMYIGGGKIVNALNPSSGVRISGLHDMPYVGAVRPG